MTQPTLQAYQVFIVRPDKRLALLRQADDVKIQSDDADTWERPSMDQLRMLTDFLEDKYTGAPKRFWNVRVGTRMGWNNEGIYLHEDHQKRFFGLEIATASVSLQAEIDQAVPMVNAKGEKLLPGTKTDRILSKMLGHLPTISDDLRYQVLQASFDRADRNNNGTLSRPELGIVLRKIIHTLRKEDIIQIIKEADTSGDGQIDCKEFVAWLRKSANSKVANAFGTSLQNEADIVRATFRLWDNNGDGLIPSRYLFHSLVKVQPELSETQVRALVQTMDADHDGNVDYDEFVDFMFHRAEQN